MSTAEIYAGLTDLFRELFADDALELSPGMTAHDVDGWDSFNHLSVMVAVETRFGVRMRTDEIESLGTIGELVATIERKQHSGR